MDFAQSKIAEAEEQKERARKTGKTELSQGDSFRKELEGKLKAEGVDLETDEARKAEVDVLVERYKDLQSERGQYVDLHKRLGDFANRTVGNGLSTLANGVLDGDSLEKTAGDTLKQLGRGLATEFLALAVANPLQNALFSKDSATLGSLGGLILSTVTSLFAEGGVMTAVGPLPLRRYAQGGIARSPQLALFGEGAGAEAYVPLPDGRSIPVSLDLRAQGRERGSPSGRMKLAPVVKQNLTFNMNGGGEGLADPQVMEDVQRELQNRTVELIENTLIRHLRLGGILNPY